jgi:hypothetical protein
MAKTYGTWTYFNGVFNDDYDDTLFGTAENDIIYGLGGDDVINLEGRFLGNPLLRYRRSLWRGRQRQDLRQ